MGIMTGNTLSLLYRSVDNRIFQDLLHSIVTLETELFFGSQQNYLPNRATLGMAGIAFAALIRFVRFTPQHIFGPRCVGVMTGGAVGFSAGHISMHSTELLFGQTVASGTKLAHRLA